MSTVATSSAVIILRSTKAPIRLHMPFDGHFGGQGNQLCQQLTDLLLRASKVSLQAMVDALPIRDLPPTERQYFSAEYLADFVEGRAPFQHEVATKPVEYEYTVDFLRGILLARHNILETTFVVPFDSFREGGFSLRDLHEHCAAILGVSKSVAATSAAASV